MLIMSLALPPGIPMRPIRARSGQASAARRTGPAVYRSPVLEYSGIRLGGRRADRAQHDRTVSRGRADAARSHGPDRSLPASSTAADWAGTGPLRALKWGCPKCPGFYVSLQAIVASIALTTGCSESLRAADPDSTRCFLFGAFIGDKNLPRRYDDLVSAVGLRPAILATFVPWTAAGGEPFPASFCRFARDRDGRT